MPALSFLLLIAFPFSVLAQFLDGDCAVQTNANNSSSPWITFLHTTDLMFVCLGTLISQKLIMTAAHCVLSNAQLIARFGEFIETSGENTFTVEYKVRETCSHPYFDIDTYDNDIALLELATNVVYTDYIRPICIVWNRSWKRYIDNIQDLKGYVWGKPLNGKDSGRRLVEIRRQPAEVCHNYINSTMGNIMSNQFCAGDSESDLCNAESSSPLVAIISYRNLRRYVQIGIATTNQKCKMPSIYTDVMSHIDFILRIWRFYGNGQSAMIPSSTT
ncbi:CLIP domain-containing serine protease B15-like isoform X2 [Drosophila eugracilis]|uniref:CLIP domain-containing serine protease B15-like isoform X2 n=1 Tax=Drosophila eugracilis TaxID=29029 RepID=UPI001BD95752|nr:CLIP domain-containing serine protease B15-like isoform X2 [Drosophila eugracilis]